MLAGQQSKPIHFSDAMEPSIDYGYLLLPTKEDGLQVPSGNIQISGNIKTSPLTSGLSEQENETSPVTAALDHGGLTPSDVDGREAEPGMN